MPEAPLPLRRHRFHSAIAEVDALLSQGPWQNQTLTEPQLRHYRKHNFQHGWRLDFSDWGNYRQIDVLVGDNFPWNAPRIAIVDPPEFLSWPHVEPDGLLCLLTSEATIDPSRPGAVTASLLADAIKLVADCEAERNQQDFRDGFATYWDRKCQKNPVRIWSLLQPKGPSRLIEFWTGKKFWIAADSTDSLDSWLSNRFQGSRRVERNYHKGLLLWLPELPCPKDYPTNASQLAQSAKKADASDLLASIYSEDLTNYLTILGGDTSAGPGFGAVIASVHEQTRYPREQRGNSIINGFRPGRAPKSLVRKRLQGSLSLTLANVERADTQWIHGRESDPRVKVLLESKVAILGCGSIGSHLACRLAEAGIGQLLLCDPEPLKWANVGRHALAGEAVGSSKAESLAETLSRSYPSAVRFQSQTESWQEVASRKPQQLLECDLLIAATGNWSAESFLNVWQKEAEFGQPIMYCWTEAYAAAGHAVATFPGNGCLQCGFTPNGSPKLSVGTWPNATLCREAGCDTAFQPYGPIALSQIIGLAAELALDCLLDRVIRSTERIWCGPKHLMTSTGGDWSEEWLSLVGDQERENFTEERYWEQAIDCRECSAL